MAASKEGAEEPRTIVRVWLLFLCGIHLKALSYLAAMGCLKLDISKKNESSLKVVGQRLDLKKREVDYYPFGEVLPGRNSNPTGMFGYQGQERITNATNDVQGSRWYNFQLRMYNPSLGRFNTIDPYS
jgi:RHS repeat-associated protein